MNRLVQELYLPWVQSTPWRDVMRPLLSSSDKREEVAGKKKENLGMKEKPVQVMMGKQKTVYFEHLELTSSSEFSPVHAEPAEMVFKIFPSALQDCCNSSSIAYSQHTSDGYISPNRGGFAI